MKTRLGIMAVIVTVVMFGLLGTVQAVVGPLDSNSRGSDRMPAGWIQPSPSILAEESTSAEEATPVDLGLIVRCDFNGDGKVDEVDFRRLTAAYGTDDSTCDLNSDGTVDRHDNSLFVQNYDTDVHQFIESQLDPETTTAEQRAETIRQMGELAISGQLDAKWVVDTLIAHIVDENFAGNRDLILGTLEKMKHKGIADKQDLDVAKNINDLFYGGTGDNVMGAARLGGTGDPRAVEPLITCLDSRHTSIRYWAAHSLREIGDPRALTPLRERLKIEPDREGDKNVYWAIEWAIEEIEETLMDKHPSIAILLKMDPEDAADILLTMDPGEVAVFLNYIPTIEAASIFAEIYNRYRGSDTEKARFVKEVFTSVSPRQTTGIVEVVSINIATYIVYHTDSPELFNSLSMERAISVLASLLSYGDEAFIDRFCRYTKIMELDKAANILYALAKDENVGVERLAQALVEMQKGYPGRPSELLGRSTQIGEEKMAGAILNAMKPEDAAEILAVEEIKLEDAGAILGTMETVDLAPILAEMKPERAADILLTMDVEKILSILGEVSDEDAAAILKAMAGIKSEGAGKILARVIAKGLRGDFNQDGKVWLEDFSLFRKAFGTEPVDENWNSACDLNGDGKVETEDFSLFVANFGSGRKVY